MDNTYYSSSWRSDATHPFEEEGDARQTKRRKRLLAKSQPTMQLARIDGLLDGLGIFLRATTAAAAYGPNSH